VRRNRLGLKYLQEFCAAAGPGLVRPHFDDHWRSRPSLADSNIGAEHATSAISLSEIVRLKLIEAYDSRRSQSTDPASEALERTGFVRVTAAKNVKRISACCTNIPGGRLSACPHQQV
jgi:hypothetical protein